MGKVSKLNGFVVKESVYVTAFPKKERGTFFVCEGEILEFIKSANNKDLCKIRIVNVAEKPLCGDVEANPRHLLGKVVTKSFKDISKQLYPMMTPKKWIK